MRTLHFATSFSPLSQTFVYDYVMELERQGVDNHVITLHRENAEARPFPNVHVVDKPSRWHPRRLWHRVQVRRQKKASPTSFWPQMRDQMENIACRTEPEVLHAHFGKAGVMIAPVAERMGIPLVVTFYGYDISALPQEQFWREAYNELWPRVDIATVLSEDMNAAAERLGCPMEKLEVVHLSRDLEQFPFRKPDGPVRSVLFVGRLVPKKAPLDAIQAVEQANERGAGLHLDLVGDGSLREQVERYVEDNDLSASVTIHGHMPNEEVSERMGTADAFLLPSKTAPGGNQEGTPTVLVEAQARGLPCVSTRHAGIPEMIPEENHHLLVEEGDVAALCDRLCRIAQMDVDELQCIAQNGREKIESEFSLTGEVRKLRAVYESAVSATVPV